MLRSRVRVAFQNSLVAASLIPPLVWLWFGLVAFAACILLAAACSGDPKTDEAIAKIVIAAEDGVIDPAEKTMLEAIALAALNGLHENGDLTDKQRDDAKLVLQAFIAGLSAKPNEPSPVKEFGIPTLVTALIVGFSHWRRNKTRSVEIGGLREQVQELAALVQR